MCVSVLCKRFQTVPNRCTYPNVLHKIHVILLENLHKITVNIRNKFKRFFRRNKIIFIQKKSPKSMRFRFIGEMSLQIMLVLENIFDLPKKSAKAAESNFNWWPWRGC